MYPKYAYEMLYKFLKENGIMIKYLNNILRRSDRTKGNAKEMLKEVVEHYYLNCEDDFVGLFNFAESSFYWDASEEGPVFWHMYHTKWIVYYKNFLEKHMVEINAKSQNKIKIRDFRLPF